MKTCAKTIFPPKISGYLYNKEEKESSYPDYPQKNW